MVRASQVPPGPDTASVHAGSTSGADSRPVVIIPAHNEATVIGAGLTTLLADAAPDEFDVVVVCNGCTDDTAARAEAAARALGHPVRVLSTPVASKPAAIRLAEKHVTGFPRLYLDADVQCPTRSARAMIAAVRGGAAVAVPTRVLDTDASSRWARAYYAGWQALPWVADQLAGRGAYTVGREARTTFGVFPDDVADDRYVTTRVPRDRAVVVDEPVVVRPPGRIADVLRVRRRVYAGNVRSEAAAHDVSRGRRLQGLTALVLNRPGLVPALAVFATTTVVAKVGAALAARRGGMAWGRDMSRDRAQSTGQAVAQPSRREPIAPATSTAPVDVVVVTYRSAGYVAECLRAAETALEELPAARIIVVDNGSDDGLSEVVRGLSPRLHLILRDVNDGFAAGCHIGADLSTARRLLFLNPDAVVEPGTVAALLACADRHPEAGIVGGMSTTADGDLDARSWFGRPTLWSALCFALGLSSLFPGSRLLDPESSEGWDGRARRVDVVSGGLMLVDRGLWDELAGFDRTYFLYGEDADLCLRAAAAGWQPRVCPEARFRHQVGASSAGSNRLPLVMRGRVTTYRRNLTPPWGRVAGELLVLGVGLRAVTAGFRPPGGRPSSGAAAWRETWSRREEWRLGWEGVAPSAPPAPTAEEAPRDDT